MTFMTFTALKHNENHIKGEFWDICNSQKNPRIQPNDDFWDFKWETEAKIENFKILKILGNHPSHILGNAKSISRCDQC